MIRWLNARRSRWLLVVYALLLIASHVTMMVMRSQSPPAPPQGASRFEVIIPAFTRAGTETSDDVRVAGLTWTPESPQAEMTPVILLHGSPGSASNFSRLGPMLASSGRLAHAIDLPGFGRSEAWAPDYSIRAHAYDTLAVMDELGIERAHVVGFSMGGGVGAWMTDIAPERVASLTLLSSIGVQKAEGSGNYYFEHAKYAVGYGALVYPPALVPHFGVLGTIGERHAVMRNFWDTDQRPMQALMEHMRTPTLILHGRRDFLVPDWGAELHHELIDSSSLVMLDTSHFMLFLGDQPDQVFAHLAPFLARHDTPDAAPLRFAADYSPESEAAKQRIDLGPFHALETTPWWILFLLIVGATWISEDATVIAVGVLIAHGQIDWGVGLLGCFVGIVLGDGGLWAIGRFAGRRALNWPFIRDWAPEESLDRWGRWFDRHTIQAVFVARAIPGLRLPTYFAAGLLSKRTHGFLFWAALAAFLWTPVLLLLAILIGPALLHTFERYLGGPLGMIVSIVVILLGVRIFSGLFTWVGRRKLARDARRLVSSEFWPRWIFYAPLMPWICWQAIRRGGFMTFTCMNPDVPHGGGVVGESKYEIIQGLLPHGDPWVVRTHLTKAGPDAEARTELVDELIRSDESLRGYPAVLKPDESQMGHAFKVVRRREDVSEYFKDMTRDALLQEFHPGPCEAGVLWARDVENGKLGPRGRIVSITRKEFPIIVGDGKSTLERLIWRHPRYRMQAEVFLRRFSGETDLVLGDGERKRLGVAGNHAQGAMFTDGADLMTPELSARIDEIASNFSCGAHEDGDIGGFDFGRFDIRYVDDESLKRGEDFAIVELNGTMSESTNLYDPSRSLLWSYGVLFRQWELMFAIGAARKRSGSRPMRLRDLLTAARDHYKGRPGSPVSD